MVIVPAIFRYEKSGLAKPDLLRAANKARFTQDASNQLGVETDRVTLTSLGPSR